MNNDTTTKVCSQCQIEKPLTEFYKDKRSKSGFVAVCIECTKANYKKRYIPKPPKTKQEKRHIAVSEKICTVCGELKSIDSFSKLKSAQDGHQFRCKKCQSDYNKKYSERFPHKKHEYYIVNKDRMRDKERAYRAENKEWYIEYQSKYRYENKDRIARLYKEWKSKNKEKVLATNHKYRARKRELECDYNSQDLVDLFEWQHGLCFWCDCILVYPFSSRHINRKTHLDHIVPLSRNGKNILENVVWACQSCNLSKHNKIVPNEWQAPNGRIGK